MAMSHTRKHRKQSYTKKQRGGLFGHFIGWHFSDRGIRRILTGNHRVKWRYTKNLRKKCKEHVRYHPKIEYTEPKMQTAYNQLRKESFSTLDNESLICGNDGDYILKYSSYRPNGSTFIGEGYEKAMKERVAKMGGLDD